MKAVYKIIIGIVIAIFAITIAVVAILVYPFFMLVDSIEEMNMEDIDGDKTMAKFMAYPESMAFIEKHPEYTEELYNTGFNFEYWLISGDTTLFINYDKETGESDITYTCSDMEGNPNSYNENLKDTIMSLC